MTDMKNSNRPIAADRNQTGIVDTRPVQGAALGRALLKPGRTLRAAMQAFRAWRRNRIAINELAQCSDWMLADIGIRRDEIRATLRRDAEQPGIVASNPIGPAIFPPRPGNDRVARKVA